MLGLDGFLKVSQRLVSDGAQSGCHDEHRAVVEVIRVDLAGRYHLITRGDPGVCDTDQPVAGGYTEAEGHRGSAVPVVRCSVRGAKKVERIAWSTLIILSWMSSRYS